MKTTSEKSGISTQSSEDAFAIIKASQISVENDAIKVIPKGKDAKPAIIKNLQANILRHSENAKSKDKNCIDRVMVDNRQCFKVTLTTGRRTVETGAPIVFSISAGITEENVLKYVLSEVQNGTYDKEIFSINN